MNHESWRSVTPQFDNFSSTLEQYQSISEIYYLDSQLRLKKSLEKFVQLSGITKVLTVKAPDNALYRSLLSEALDKITPENVPIISTESLSFESIFGSYSVNKTGEVSHQQPGLIDKADGGILLVSANLITANPVGWFKLKSALFGESIEPINLSGKNIPTKKLSKNYDLKLIVVGSRETLDDFQYIDSDINDGFNLYTEYELEIELTEQSFPVYLGFIKWLCNKYALPELTSGSLVKLMAEGARYTEDQNYLPLDVMWYRNLLEEAAIERTSDSTFTDTDIDNAIEAKYFREAYLPERALSDILMDRSLSKLKVNA